MHETLKIIISTFVVVVITSIAFFAIYFLAPSVSEDLFGISYRLSKENPIETFSSSFMEGPAEKSPSLDVDEVSKEDLPAEDASLSQPEREETESLTESGEKVEAFISSLSEQMKGQLASRIGTLPDSMDDEGVERLNAAGKYLEENNLDISDVFTGREFFNYMQDKGSSAIESVVAFLGGMN